MNFKDFFELIQFDLILEGLGVVAGFGLLWNLFFNDKIHQLFELFILSIC